MLLYFSTLNLKSKEEARKSGEILPPIFNRETGLRSLPRMRYNSPKLQSLKLGVLENACRHEMPPAARRQRHFLQLLK